MHIACANGYTSILEFLLVDCQIAIESGAGLIPPSIFATDNDGWTPLHVATFWGHVSCSIYYQLYNFSMNWEGCILGSVHISFV